MARGVIAGILSGVVVGGLGLATLSVVNGPSIPARSGEDGITDAPIRAPQVVGEADVDAVEETETPTDVEAGPVPETVPAPAPAGEEEPEAAPTVAAEAPAQPEMSDVQPEVDQGAGDAAGVAPTPDPQPALSETQSQAPRPDDAPPAPEAAVPQPAPAAGEAAPGPTPLPQIEAVLDPSLSEGMAPEDEAGATLPSAEDGAAQVPVPAPLTDPVQPPASPEGAAPPAPNRATDDPITTFSDRASNVTTDRLPRIGSAEGKAESEAEQVPAAMESSPLAIIRNGAAFDRPEGMPLLAVVLHDQPGERAALGDLASLPFPITFVVSAEQSDVAEALAFYRAAGAEVLLSVALPEGATPVDAEVTLQAHASLMADAVGLQVGAGFQTAGETADQVAQVLVEGGHGLVSLPEGLNTGHKRALKAGVPAGLVFRDLDGEGQSAAVIRRFLDNAAFKARQEQGVILLGRARAETLQALIEWSLGNRVKSVAMAPVSAVLLGG